MPEPDQTRLPAAARRDRLTVAVLIVLVVLALILFRRDTEEHQNLWLLGTAFGIGLFLPLLYWHPYRILGVVAPALTIATGAAVWAASVGEWQPVAIVIVAFSLALGLGSLSVVTYSQFGEGRLLLLFLLPIVCAAAFKFLPVPAFNGFNQLVLPAFVGLTAVFAWVRLFRPVFELCVEPPLWWMYHIRPAGPDLAKVPPTGPCLILANHGCYLDPLFLAKILPRPITPMMTARFYDLPILRPLMVYFGIIRVPEKPLKRDVPEEIEDAIAALDRGACVVIFPEGYLRRTEEKPLKRFGRGVWQILQARPNTPVFACWIEGSWGSYMSYYNGKPMQNKKRDFRRPIGIGVVGPVETTAEQLAAHLRTRLHLMNAVASARVPLGLSPLPPFDLAVSAAEDEKDEPANGSAGG